MVEILIEQGTIAQQIDDEGNLGRLKQVLNEVTFRLMNKVKTQALKDKMKERTKDLEKFINQIIVEHNNLFRLVKKLSKSQKETGECLADLSDKLSSSEQGIAYQKILTSIIHRFMSENGLGPDVNLEDRPNIYREYSYELNMLYEILFECHETKARRMHLCLGCWQIISFGNSTLQKYKNVGFKEKNYPLLINLGDLVDTQNGDKVDEPKIYLQDVIYFLWYSGHIFFEKQLNLIMECEQNSTNFNYMPFPQINLQEKGKKSSIAGSLL